MGWTTSPESQQHVIKSLTLLGVEVLAFEVCSKIQLVNVLQSLKGHIDLVWPNAYQVYAFEGSEETIWLADIINEQGLSIIGSDATTLKNLILKDRCQTILHEQGVAIPGFVSLDNSMLHKLDDIICNRNLTFPLFTKPNALSTSKGITQDCVVHNVGELGKQVKLLGEQFGYPVMVEEYLPGQDITVAVFITSSSPVILATYYDTEIYDDPGAVLDHSIRLLDWDDRKSLRVVSEPEVLDQIEPVVLDACKALNVTEFTRIDCRMDRCGKLKIFDVNGLPGLEMPFSTTVWQMIVKMQDHPQQYAFDTLISLVIYCAAQRHKIMMPARIKELAENYINNVAVEALCLEPA